MIKIRLFAWWTDSNSITNRFKQQFIGDRFDNPDIEFVTNSLSEPLKLCILTVEKD